MGKKTKGKAAKNEKKKRREAESESEEQDGDIGKIRKNFKKKQAADRRRRRISSRKAATTPASAAVAALDEAVAALAKVEPPAEQQHQQPKEALSPIKCLDEMARTVQKYASTMMNARVTAESAYLVANLATVAVQRVLDHAIKLGMQGMGTAERPLDALAIHAGARSVITDDNLTLVLLFRIANAIAAERGTLDQTTEALGMFIESRQGSGSTAQDEPRQEESAAEAVTSKFF